MQTSTPMPWQIWPLKLRRERGSDHKPKCTTATGAPKTSEDSPRHTQTEAEVFGIYRGARAIYLTKLPQGHTRALYAALSSDEAAILVQARTDKTRLNSSLARIRVVESEQCECGRGAETVQHVLLSCPQWTQQREVLRQTLGGHIGDIGRLLGAWSARQDYRTGRYLLGPKDKWRANIRTVKATIGYLSATGRFIDSGIDAAIHPIVANGPT